MMENSHLFTKTEQKEGCSCNPYNIALCNCKKRRIPIYLIKTVFKRSFKRKLNAIIQHEESSLGWTGKLQITLPSGCISRKKLCSQTFKPSSEEVTVMYSEKIKAKYMKKEDVWMSLFSLTCRLGSRTL